MTLAQVVEGGKRVLLGACALLIMLAVVIALGTPSRALAGGGRCDLHTLRGSYVFAATGHNIMGGVPQPKAIIEVVDFNADGTLTVPAATVSVNGNIFRSFGGGGSYTLDSECRGTITFTGGPTFDVFTDQTGKQGWMIQTNPNTVFQGTVTKVSP